mgnify:CR=1 FL=1
MLARLYPSTRPLYQRVMQVLTRLQVGAICTPTQLALIGLYIAGLILLDVDQTNTRITQYLPARCHDALNRLLRVMPFSSRALLQCCAAWVRRQGVLGHFSLDDVIVPKPFSATLRWATKLWCPSEKRYVHGMCIVVLSWGWSYFKVPLAIRLWCPRKHTRAARYRTKLQLAQEMLREVLPWGLPVAYLVFDGWYTAGWFTKWLTRVGLTWVGAGAKNAKVVYHRRTYRLDALPATLKLKWRKVLGLRAATAWVYLPTLGHVRLVVTRDAHGHVDYILSNARTQDLCTLVLWKRSRWNIETLFRNSKQLAGLAMCQCRVPQAMVRHVTLVFVTCFVLDLLRTDPSQTTDGIRQQLQLEVVTHGFAPPQPLRARTM